MTTDQLALDLAPVVQPATVGGSIQERFEAFHDANPWVCRALEQLTADLVGRGRRRIGIKSLFEVLRWHYNRATEGDDFRLNNSYTSRYARLLIDRHPEWADVFETRELRAA